MQPLLGAGLMNAETRTLLYYVALIVVGALAAGLGVLATQLAGPGDVVWKPIMAAAIGPVVAGLLSMRLPQPSRAALSEQADHLESSDVPTLHLVVVDAGSKRAADKAVVHAEKAEAGEKVEPMDHTIPTSEPS